MFLILALRIDEVATSCWPHPTLTRRAAADIMPFTGHEEIDRAAAFSNDRNVTTRIAEWLRGVTLDDGSELAGVKFESRVGNDTCWAYWMRRTDLGLTEVAKATAGVEISSKEPAMVAVTEAWEIRTW
ncbi:MAG: hypothetical protein H7039_05205 [Bryobacteraceae bacterium]|nr:hypothetical protein [Bryobacteraceae bacterium]